MYKACGRRVPGPGGRWLAGRANPQALLCRLGVCVLRRSPLENGWAQGAGRTSSQSRREEGSDHSASPSREGRLPRGPHTPSTLTGSVPACDHGATDADADVASSRGPGRDVLSQSGPLLSLLPLSLFPAPLPPPREPGCHQALQEPRARKTDPRTPEVASDSGAHRPHAAVCLSEEEGRAGGGTAEKMTLNPGLGRGPGVRRGQEEWPREPLAQTHNTGPREPGGQEGSGRMASGAPSRGISVPLLAAPRPQGSAQRTTGPSPRGATRDPEIRQGSGEIKSDKSG